MSLSENPSKFQRTKKGRPNTKAQDGGSGGGGGFSLQLAQEVTESIGKLSEETLANFTNALEFMISREEGNSKRLDQVEGRMFLLEDMLSTTEIKVRDAENKLQTLIEKIDDMENRTRRDNIRVVGLKEGAEGEQPVAFFERWLPKILNWVTKPTCSRRSPQTCHHQAAKLCG